MNPAVTPERRERVREVVGRYRRRARLLRVALLLPFVVAVVAAAAVGNALAIVGVGLVGVALLVGPVLDPTARAVYVTDADPDAVRDALAGPYSPPLALVWGRGEVRATDRGGEYEWSMLGGLRSATLSWDAEDREEGQRVVYAANGEPKAYYDTAVRREDGETVLDIETRYEGRVGLNVLPGVLAARGLRREVWAAQGYERRTREGSLV
ncbi:hypothetical protein [Halosegnis marinus]|uniref:Polyketide cyclase / dehydrase and lipid transport n=1 Tax=Halosegnis marinus TaxID=3034023 RepID=A0ABD5ZMN5_9EURY|nr:hypothetical protein [Halosegnis sp. DT85]